MNVTPTEPFEEGEQTLIRPDRHHQKDPQESGDDLEREGVEKPRRNSERSKADSGEEPFFKGTTRLETKSKNRRKGQSSLVKQGKNAMMSSISPREEQLSSKARKSFNAMYDERMASLRTDGLSSGFDHPGLMHSDTDFTPNPRQEKVKKAMSNSPLRPKPDGMTMGNPSIFERLMISVRKQQGGVSSSTRLQPQMASSSLGLSPVLGTASDVSGIFSNVMTSLEELRQSMTKRIDRVEEGLNGAMKG